MRILLVEDHADIAEFIQRGLEEERYQVTVARDGDDGLQKGIDELFGLIILDIMLPGRDGIAICEEFRNRWVNTPILMLTARDAVADRVRGLQVGADDYLAKPFDFAELLARVQALLRRDRLHKGRTIVIGDLEIDTRTRSVRRSGRDLTFTEREYTLLEALAARSGQVLSREYIQEHVWQDEDSLSNTVDVHMAQLRKKLDSGHDAKLIHTVYGQGYTLKLRQNPSERLP